MAARGSRLRWLCTASGDAWRSSRCRYALCRHVSRADAAGHHCRPPSQPSTAPGRQAFVAHAGMDTRRCGILFQFASVQQDIRWEDRWCRADVAARFAHRRFGRAQIGVGSADSRSRLPEPPTPLQWCSLGWPMLHRYGAVLRPLTGRVRPHPTIDPTL